MGIGVGAEVSGSSIQPLAEHPGGLGVPDLTAQDDQVVRMLGAGTMGRSGDGSAGDGQHHKAQGQQSRQHPAEKILLQKVVDGDQNREPQQGQSGESVAGQTEKQERPRQCKNSAEEPFRVDSFHSDSFLP